MCYEILHHFGDHVVMRKNTQFHTLSLLYILLGCILVEWAVWTSFTCLLCLAHCVACWFGGWALTAPSLPFSPAINTWCTLSNASMPGLFFCSVVVILLVRSTSSHEDAGDVIASHLHKWKNLRKVKVYCMNPVPILLSVGSCDKLDEVVIQAPQHCKVSIFTDCGEMVFLPFQCQDEKG